MEDVLLRIKRAVIQGNYVFTDKARLELLADGLAELDIAEAIIGAAEIQKVLRSRSRLRRISRELLYVIEGRNFEGIRIYTKGKLARRGDIEVYYLLISSKRAIPS